MLHVVKSAVIDGKHMCIFSILPCVFQIAQRRESSNSCQVVSEVMLQIQEHIVTVCHCRDLVI